MLQWHIQGFELPDGCIQLASSEVFPNQAFRYDNHTYGVQFHPEVTAEVLAVWHRRLSANDHFPTDELHLRRQQNDCVIYDRENEQWLNHFMHSWVNS